MIVHIVRLAIVFSISMFGACSAFAGKAEEVEQESSPTLYTYELTRNKALPLCQKIAAHIKKSGPYPLKACPDMMVPWDDPDFKAISWEELNVSEYRDLAIRFYLENKNAFRPGASSSPPYTLVDLETRNENVVVTRLRLPDGSFTDIHFLDALDAGQVVLGRASFDIDFDGQNNIVYRLGMKIGGCAPSQIKEERIYSYHIDSDVSQELVRDVRKFAAGRNHFAFWHQGRPFFMTAAFGGFFIVYQSVNSKTISGAFGLVPVCEFMNPRLIPSK